MPEKIAPTRPEPRVVQTRAITEEGTQRLNLNRKALYKPVTGPLNGQACGPGSIAVNCSPSLQISNAPFKISKPGATQAAVLHGGGEAFNVLAKHSFGLQALQ